MVVVKEACKKFATSYGVGVEDAENQNYDCRRNIGR